MNWQFIFIVGKNSTNFHQSFNSIIIGDMSEHKGIISRLANHFSILFSKIKRKTFCPTGRVFLHLGLVFVATTILFFLNIHVWDTSKPSQPLVWDNALRFNTQFIEEFFAPLGSFEPSGIINIKPHFTTEE
jgi:hypothetical protein